ncbi:MAG TPA: GNAT family N-acetyltransferase [Azospirillaceae bacterium]|nr:GNAT family N-acetyltransferase [Azospirillaceae bacterium]
MDHHRLIRGRHFISTDPGLIDIDAVHRFLSTESYWARGIPREAVEHAARHSLLFGLYDAERTREDGAPVQLGYARVLSDRTMLAYLLDVFILAEHRGRGLARWLVETILDHPELREVPTWMLGTRDSHGLYAKLGFVPVEGSGRYMRRAVPPPWSR